MRDQEIREALNQHWTASNSGDFATEHAIYHEDAALDYPQSRERIIGRQDIQIARTLQPKKSDLWFIESWVAATRGSQYFADAFEPGESRKKWVVSMDSPKVGQGSAEPRNYTGAH
jgi:hypothetical protein